MNPASNKNRFFIEVALVLILATYVVFFSPNLFDKKSDYWVGYLDVVEEVQALDNISQGQIPQKDFYWSYGPLYLYLQWPAYMLLGRNHDAVVTIWATYLPFLSILMSYLWALVFFPSSFYRILFLLFCVFQNANSLYSSPRHLIAELAIAAFILAVRKEKDRRLFFATGGLCALALLTSQEYGSAAIATLVLAGIVLYFSNRPIPLKRSLGWSLLGLAALGAPYYLYLTLNDSLTNYFRFTFGWMRGFINPAARDMFPVLPSLSFSGWGDFVQSFYGFFTSKDLWFYVPLGLYLSSVLIYFSKFFRSDRKSAFEFFVVAIYGMGIYARTLTGPAHGYLSYGLVPAITLGLFFLHFLQNTAAKYFRETKHLRALALCCFIGTICFWIFRTVERPALRDIFTNLNLKKRTSEFNAGKEYDARSGYYLTPHSKDEYAKITTYLQNHTPPGSYLLVYPWGPYNHFANRPSPITAILTYHFQAGERFIDEALKQLEDKKPNFVALNTYNSLGMVRIGGKREDVGDSATWGTPDSPSFAGKGDKLQVYILENYALEKQFEYAAILRRRDVKRPYVRRFEIVRDWTLSELKHPDKTEGTEKPKDERPLKATGRDSSFFYETKPAALCSHVEVVLRLRNGPIKRFLSKNVVKVNLKYSGSTLASENRVYDLMNYNRPTTIWMGFSKGLKASVDTVEIEILTPGPYLLPQEFEIEKIQLLLENQ